MIKLDLSIKKKDYKKINKIIDQEAERIKEKVKKKKAIITIYI
jgi:hypothetical protein